MLLGASTWPFAATRNLLLANKIRCEAAWSVVYLWQKACKNGNSDCPRGRLSKIGLPCPSRAFLREGGATAIGIMAIRAGGGAILGFQSYVADAADQVVGGGLAVFYGDNFDG